MKDPRLERKDVRFCVFCDDPFDASLQICPYCQTDQSTRQPPLERSIPADRSKPVDRTLLIFGVLLILTLAIVLLGR